MRTGRAFVPDLSPQAHPERRWAPIRAVFVAESPHVNEVAPERRAERRPLCGRSGRLWWAEITRIVEGAPSADVSLERLLDFCATNGIAVLNAVQTPLDPEVARKAPFADPRRLLGFTKASGPLHYKKRCESEEVRRALTSLRRRLAHPSLAGALARAGVVCLGCDAEWFVTRALAPVIRVERVAHPAAWWQRRGDTGRQASRQLGRIFK